MIARSFKDADLVLTLRTYARRQPPKLKEALERDIPMHLLRSQSVAHIEEFLTELLEADDGRDAAVAEAEDAARVVCKEHQAIALRAHPAALRRQQHAVAERFGIASISRGREPNRRVVLLPLEEREDLATAEDAPVDLPSSLD